jgi:hypothetical protein
MIDRAALFHLTLPLSAWKASSAVTQNWATFPQAEMVLPQQVGLLDVGIKGGDPGSGLFPELS